MAIKKIYGGSTVGPLLYNDALTLDDPDGDFAGVDFHALVTDGQLWVEQVPVLDEEVLRLADIDTLIAPAVGGMFQNTLFPEPGSADQGKTAVANADGYTTVKDIVDAIGTSEKATIVFRHTGAANTTIYTFATTTDITGNYTVIIEPGAVLVDSGNVSLEIKGPFWAQRVQCFDWDGTSKVVFRTSLVNHGRVDTVYPEWWGAIPDGSTDCSGAIQKALDSSNGFGIIVQLGLGIYMIDTGLTVEAAEQILGSGWSYKSSGAETTPSALASNGAVGTWIGVDQNITAITCTGAGWQLKDFAMWWKHDSPDDNTWVPTTYGPAISLKTHYPGGNILFCDDGKIENILLLNPYQGIVQYDGNGMGRLKFNNISGEPFQHGLWLKATAAVNQISNIQFGVIWGAADESGHYPYSDWKEENGCGFEIDRADGSQFVNLEANNYLIGFCFGYEASGFAHSMLHCRFVNLYADGCKYPVFFSADSDGHNATFENLYLNSHSYASGSPITDSRAWYNAGDNNNISINNIVMQYSGEEAFAIGGTANIYQIDNFWIHAWNNDNGDHAPTNITAGNYCYMGSQRRITGALNGVAATIGGAGTIIKDGEGFGAYSELLADTVYQASTDGFVHALIRCNASGDRGRIQGNTDGANPPTQERVRESASYNETDGVEGWGSFTMAVKNGNYWKVVLTQDNGTSSTRVEWVPVSHWKHPYN